MPNGEACWFCGGGVAGEHTYRVGLHRDHESTFLGLGFRDEWQRTEVAVPRCRRCRLGHALEVVLLVAGIPAFAWAFAVTADTALGNYNAAPRTVGTLLMVVGLCLPLALWAGLRFGLCGLRRWHPGPRRHARRHPAVRALMDGGWKYGAAPWLHWDRRL